MLLPDITGRSRERCREHLPFLLSHLPSLLPLLLSLLSLCPAVASAASAWPMVDVFTVFEPPLSIAVRLPSPDVAYYLIGTSDALIYRLNLTSHLAIFPPLDVQSAVNYTHPLPKPIAIGGLYFDHSARLYTFDRNNRVILRLDVSDRFITTLLDVFALDVSASAPLIGNAFAVSPDGRHVFTRVGAWLCILSTDTRAMLNVSIAGVEGTEVAIGFPLDPSSPKFYLVNSSIDPSGSVLSFTVLTYRLQPDQTAPLLVSSTPGPPFAVHWGATAIGRVVSVDEGVLAMKVVNPTGMSQLCLFDLRSSALRTGDQGSDATAQLAGMGGWRVMLVTNLNVLWIAQLSDNSSSSSSSSTASRVGVSSSSSSSSGVTSIITGTSDSSSPLSSRVTSSTVSSGATSSSGGEAIPSTASVAWPSSSSSSSASLTPCLCPPPDSAGSGQSLSTLAIVLCALASFCVGVAATLLAAWVHASCGRQRESGRRVAAEHSAREYEVTYAGPPV